LFLVSGVGLVAIFVHGVRSECLINSGPLSVFRSGKPVPWWRGNEVSEASGVEDRLGNFATVQERVADALGICLDGDYRPDQRSNFLISMLGSYIWDMGGRLLLVAESSHREPVILFGIAASATKQRIPLLHRDV
jgi:hypothetical protein